LGNANHHALTVDVADLQTTQFGPPHGGGVQGHEQDAVIEIAGRVDEEGHLLWTEHSRQSLGGFRKRDAVRQKVPSQRFDEQEAQRGHVLRDRGRSQLLGLEQVSLILPYLLGAELVGRLVKMFRERPHDSNVGFRGTRRVITTLEFLQHLFA